MWSHRGFGDSGGVSPQKGGAFPVFPFFLNNGASDQKSIQTKSIGNHILHNIAFLVFFPKYHSFCVNMSESGRKFRPKSKLLNGRKALANCDKSMKLSAVILNTIKFNFRCGAILDLGIRGVAPPKGGSPVFHFFLKNGESNKKSIQTKVIGNQILHNIAFMVFFSRYYSFCVNKT